MTAMDRLNFVSCLSALEWYPTPLMSREEDSSFQFSTRTCTKPRYASFLTLLALIPPRTKSDQNGVLSREEMMVLLDLQWKQSVGAVRSRTSLHSVWSVSHNPSLCLFANQVLCDH